jgi:hypothetical protein
MEGTTTPGERPTFLTVLCILSFIWAGFGILAGGMGYVGMKMIESGALEEMVASSGDTNAIAQLEEAQAKFEESGLDAGQTANLILLSVVLSIAAFIGVLMMWKLKRSGFWVYATTAVIGLVAPLLFGGNLDMSISGIVISAISILFIALYALNLKHMH